MMRFLTPESKAATLAEWGERKKDSLRPDGDEGGAGYVDPEMFPICDAVNAIDGVCTLQSCCGHWREYEGDRQRYAAELWLWLSEPIFKRWTKHAWRLKSIPLFEVVRTIHLAEYDACNVQWKTDPQHGGDFLEGGRQLLHFLHEISL